MRWRSRSSQPLTSDQKNSFLAALLGWTMDAFDYFIVVLVYADIAETFGKSKETVALLTTATLLMRPVGALHLRPLGRPGRPSDAADRRRPLLLDRRLPVRVRTQLHRAASCCASSTASAWAASGASAPRSRWRRSRRSAAASSPACCSRATPWATCWPPSSFLIISDGLRPVLALAVRPLDPAGADQPAHPHPGPGVRGVGGEPRADSTVTQTSVKDVIFTGTVLRRFIYLVRADDGVQLDEPRHPGRLPDLPEGHRLGRRRARASPPPC